LKSGIFGDLSIALDPALIMKAAGLLPDPWQADLLRSTADRYLLLCTRQAGKSTSTAALALWEAIYNAPALVLCLSPSLRQSQELFKKVLWFLGAFPQRVPIRKESELRVEMENGSRIVALPATEATVRGYSGVRLLLIDEASRVEDALYFSVRPMLAVSGGRIVAMTTPFGKRGFFYDAWNDAGDDWQRVKITANECPRITQEFLEEERRAVGDWWFRQEYMCDFVDTVDQVFSYEDVTSALSSEIKPLFGGI